MCFNSNLQTYARNLQNKLNFFLLRHSWLFFMHLGVSIQRFNVHKNTVGGWKTIEIHTLMTRRRERERGMEYVSVCESSQLFDT